MKGAAPIDSEAVGACHVSGRDGCATPKRERKTPVHTDGYAWIKYGEKVIAPSSTIREYFKCRNWRSPEKGGTSCPARKVVDGVKKFKGRQNGCPSLTSPLREDAAGTSEVVSNLSPGQHNHEPPEHAIPMTPRTPRTPSGQASVQGDGRGRVAGRKRPLAAGAPCPPHPKAEPSSPTEVSPRGNPTASEKRRQTAAATKRAAPGTYTSSGSSMDPAAACHLAPFEAVPFMKDEPWLPEDAGKWQLAKSTPALGAGTLLCSETTLEPCRSSGHPEEGNTFCPDLPPLGPLDAFAFPDIVDWAGLPEPWKPPLAPGQVDELYERGEGAGVGEGHWVEKEGDAAGVRSEEGHAVMDVKPIAVETTKLRKPPPRLMIPESHSEESSSLGGCVSSPLALQNSTPRACLQGSPFTQKPMPALRATFQPSTSSSFGLTGGATSYDRPLLPPVEPNTAALAALIALSSTSVTSSPELTAAVYPQKKTCNNAVSEDGSDHALIGALLQVLAAASKEACPQAQAMHSQVEHTALQGNSIQRYPPVLAKGLQHQPGAVGFEELLQESQASGSILGSSVQADARLLQGGAVAPSTPPQLHASSRQQYERSDSWFVGASRSEMRDVLGRLPDAALLSLLWDFQRKTMCQGEGY